MKKLANRLFVHILALALLHPFAASGASQDEASEERGRYLVKIAGCNDCHTPGYLMANGAIPEAQWLVGDSFGWRGPWGTTYATNLRIRLNSLTEDQWVAFARALKARPPMPSRNLNEMHESDLRSIHRFIRKLGKAGTEAPAYLPPGTEPPPPFATFPSPPPQVKLVAGGSVIAFAIFAFGYDPDNYQRIASVFRGT